MSQTLKEIEVIAVNDGSTDNSLMVLEEYQSKYADIMKVYTTENQGVSHARNYGLARAGGEYVLFVDSDDFIEKDMCEKLYDKAVRDQNCVVICGRYNVFEREHIGEMKREKFETHLISRNFKLSENKFELAHITPFPWDKLFKRSILEGIEFPEKMRFEDLVFVYKVICRAESIGVVEEPLYNYRRTTQGGFLNSFSEQTLDIVRAFQILFEFMNQYGYMEMYHDELEYICARHFLFRYGSLFKYENKGKLAIKIEIIKKTQEFLDKEFPRWRRNHYLRYSSGNLKPKLKLYTNQKKMLHMTKVREYMPLIVVKYMAKFRDQQDKWKKRMKKWKRSRNKLGLIKKKLPLLAVLLQSGAVYYTRMYEKLPVAPRDILFESKHGEDIAGNIFALIQELSKAEYKDYRVSLAMEPEYRDQYQALLHQYQIHNVKMIEIRSKEYMRALASAKYLITDTSFPPYYIKKREQVYLNTWHGTPLKAMGKIVPQREYALGNVQRNFLIADYLLYQNEFSRDVFMKDYMLENMYQGNVLLSGYPRNSVFFNKSRYQQIRRDCGLEQKQVIVYMPTWRGLLHKKETDKQLERLNLYFYQIDQKLREDQIFYVKLHPFVKEEMDLTGYSHIREFPAGYETYDFLNACDVLVTDYSSIMFDFGVTKRKMILFTYDREEYLTGRGLYIDLEQLELPKADTVDELITELNAGNKEYPEFYKRFCAYDSADTPKQVIETLLYGKTGEQNNFKVQKNKLPDKKKVFIFIKGMKRDDYTARLIRIINEINTDQYNVYVCMKAEDVRKATEMLTQINEEIGYLPIQYEINYTRMDYILSKLCLNFGGRIITGRRNDKIMRRENLKYFGDVSFDYAIHQSELDRMVGHMCCEIASTSVYNFKYFDYDRYRDHRAYRKQVKYFIRRFSRYMAVVATKEYQKLKRKDSNIYYNEEVVFPMSKILEEATQHEGRSHHIS